jgi:diguanylate cyclase
MPVRTLDRWLRRSEPHPARASDTAPPSTATPTGVDEETVGRMVDAAGTLMQLVGTFAHDTDARTAAAAKYDAERWRRHLTLGAEHPTATERQSGAVGERDWDGAVRHAIADRRAEHAYVARTTAELSETMWTLVQGLHRVVDAECAAGRESAGRVERLRGAVRDAAPSAMRDVVLGALGELAHHVAARDRARDAQLASLGDQINALGAALEEARRDGATDALTGLGNRRAFDAAAEHAVALHGLWRQPVSLVMFDVDGLKAMNDTHGHAAGDDGLRGVAGRLSRVFLRRTDVVARVGGDEFAVVLRETTAAAAARLATRAAVTPDAPTALGVSAGVAELRVGESAADWCARADAALYAAKRAGKGRVEV